MIAFPETSMHRGELPDVINPDPLRESVAPVLLVSNTVVQHRHGTGEGLQYDGKARQSPTASVGKVGPATREQAESDNIPNL